MKWLSLLLDKGAREGKFNYHHNCKDSRLTHLCFADDLLIFTDGSVRSVESILEVLKLFERQSGLAASISKTSFYTCGLSIQEINEIKSISGLFHGELPIRYLGVPLTTKKLSFANCQPLLLHVKGKINSWSAKSLSFAGRLLLINTVVAGISNFWCAAFVLPKAIIKCITTLCNACLWKGSSEGSYNARVAWDTITNSKEEGGLGVRNLIFWNKACLLKLVWILFFRSGSIWVAWWVKNILSGSVNNFWSIETKQSHSWLTKKLINIRDVVFSWIKVRVQDGRTTRFWTDNWCSLGKVKDLLQGTNTMGLRIPNRATLRDLWEEGHWILPPARSEAQVGLWAHISTLVLTEGTDYIEWQVADKVTTSYSTGEIYNRLKPHSPIVPWAKAVWCTRDIPKHNFLTWLFVLNRCPTAERIHGWGLAVELRCSFCNRGIDSRDHLFFVCSYSWSIWEKIARRCRFTPSSDWNTTLNCMQSLSCPKPQRILTIFSSQCDIYSVWTERNTRRHRQAFRSADSVFNAISSTIKNRIASFRDTNPSLTSLMFQQWIDF